MKTDTDGTATAIDLAAMQARFRRMILLVCLCAVVGGAAILAFFAGHQTWGLWVFLATLVSGFAVQLWFVAAIRRG